MSEMQPEASSAVVGTDANGAVEQADDANARAARVPFAARTLGQDVVVRLGNPAPKHNAGTATGPFVTEIVLDASLPRRDAFANITAPGGAWAAHSDAEPDWVSSSDPSIAQMLAGHFGCSVRDFDNEG